MYTSDTATPNVLPQQQRQTPAHRLVVTHEQACTYAPGSQRTLTHQGPDSVLTTVLHPPGAPSCPEQQAHRRRTLTSAVLPALMNLQPTSSAELFLRAGRRQPAAYGALAECAQGQHWRRCQHTQRAAAAQAAPAAAPLPPTRGSAACSAALMAAATPRSQASSACAHAE